ncbi:MAG TPA: cation:proton antiporter [Candidatus Sulfotelmatobacter sp.]|nr:cation:proton antiporter [Candidatus Sulfotelmatobacter sp.]
MVNMFTLVLQIAVVLAVCRLVGNVFLKIYQPRVVGEMFAGIMLGPSLLGWLAPQSSAFLFPAARLGFLSALSQVGVIVFMFLPFFSNPPQSLNRPQEKP